MNNVPYPVILSCIPAILNIFHKNAYVDVIIGFFTTCSKSSINPGSHARNPLHPIIIASTFSSFKSITHVFMVSCETYDVNSSDFKFIVFHLTTLILFFSKIFIFSIANSSIYGINIATFLTPKVDIAFKCDLAISVDFAVGETSLNYLSINSFPSVKLIELQDKPNTEILEEGIGIDAASFKLNLASS